MRRSPDSPHVFRSLPRPARTGLLAAGLAALLTSPAGMALAQDESQESADAGAPVAAQTETPTQTGAQTPAATPDPAAPEEPASEQPAPAPVSVDPFVALSNTDGGPTSNQMFYFSAATGNGTLASGLRRDPEQLRVSRLDQNLFREIGRAADPLARQGEVLFLPILRSDGSSESAVFVETGTGYTTFFEDLGRGGQLGKLITLIGRPFGPLASTDANFALLPRRDESGRTQGAYLYHATSGRALYLSDLQELGPDPGVSSVVQLPQLTGYVSAAPIYLSEQTVSIAVIDHGSGKLQFFDLGQRPEQVSVRISPLNSFTELFQAETYNPISTRRFQMLPVQDDDDTTTVIFLVDVATGQLATIGGLRSPTAQQLNVLPQNIYSALPGGIAKQPRAFTLVAHEESGGTRGFWLADSLTRRFVYVSNLANPSGPTLRTVAFDR